MTAATRVNAVLQLYHKAALSEIILVSDNSKSRAAAQARTSWAQRLSTAQAESLPPTQSKASAHRTEEGTGNKVYEQSQTSQSKQRDTGSGWREQAGIARGKTRDCYTCHVLEAGTEFLVRV